MFLQKPFQCNRSQIFFKLGVIVNFPIITRESLFNPCFNKVTGLMACNFIKKETPTQVFSCECLKMFEKNFLWNTSGGCFWEWFWRISKDGLTWTICMIYLISKCKLLNRGNFLHWNVDDMILKRSDEFYIFRFVWNEEIKQLRVTQIVITQKSFRVKPP